MLDEWTTALVVSSRSAQDGAYPTEEDDEAFESTSGGNVLRTVDSPIFSVDLLERHATKGHGLVMCMSAGNNVIVVGMNRGWMVCHDFGGGETLEFDLSGSNRGVEQKVHRVLIDPCGRHSLASVCSTAGAENYYIHAKWKKHWPLSKLKGHVINAVAWNRQQINDGERLEHQSGSSVTMRAFYFLRSVSRGFHFSAAYASVVSTRACCAAAIACVIVGTTTGQLFELVMEEKDKKEKYVNKLFELSERLEPFVGVQVRFITKEYTRSHQEWHLI